MTRPTALHVPMPLAVFVLLNLSAALGAAQGPAAATAAAVAIDADYGGGNVIVEKIEGDVVQLRPDLRDTNGWWFYFNFRVRGAAGRTLRFRFSGNNPIGVRGPAVSVDQGKSWSWLGAEAVKGAAFTYAFGADAKEVRFSFAIPYLERDLREFLDRHKGDTHLAVREHCKSKAGRSVERIHAGKLEGEPRFRVLLTSRHHACESMGTYAMEGLLEAVLADSEDGRWFRENVELAAVPFMDKDGVEQGDQGKNRKPRDHNRDYAGQSVHPEVAAMREFAPRWSGGRLAAAFDLHCPWIRGPHNEVIYLVGSRHAKTWEQQQAFGRLLEKLQSGPLAYKAADNLPFGQAWNTGANTGANKSFAQWASELEDVRLAASFEIPYANAGGRVVTGDAARQFGRSLAGAIRAYLEGR